MYGILSLDGGGLRGVVSLAIIEKLDIAVPGWRNGINMYAGTSTGGLIALGLAKKMTPSQIMDVYMNNGPKIFDRSLWHEIANLGDISGPKYDSTNRMETVQQMLGNDRLSSYLSGDNQDSGHVVITAFDLINAHATDAASRSWKPKIFHNVPIKPEYSNDGSEYAWKVAMYTSAAPTYFASYEGFVDGGVFANNPAMCALAQTQDDRNLVNHSMEEIYMFSIGTGVRPFHLDGDESWGLVQWAPKLVDLMMDGVNEVADFQVKQMLPDGHYCRINPDLTVDIPMDAVDLLGTMQRVGNSVSITDSITNFLSKFLR
jgi:patatin-like phospholipase/acyl hydrolase